MSEDRARQSSGTPDPAATLKGLSGGKVPAHVPEALVFRLDELDQPNDRIDPFSIAANYIEDFPPIFYWPRPRPGLNDGTWVVTRYEDIREVYQRDEYYSTEGAANFQSLVGETFRMLPLAVDRPEHTKYRSLLNPWFSPKAITEIEPNIRAVITSLIDDIASRSECDVAYEFGRVYPVKVFLSLMGLPHEDFDDFLQWEYALLHSRGDVEKMRWGARGALDYLRAYIETVKATPNEGLVSKIVHGSLSGEPLTDDEIIGIVFFLWVGGLDTVAATTALMFRRLALQPELQDQLRANPDLAGDAIEEFLRIQPLVNSSRLVKVDHEIHGVTVQKGEHVMCLNTTGNFDPAEFDRPREILFDRPSNRHFTLAGGAHRCLGSHLARRELRIALTEFLRRVPPFRLAPGSDQSAVPGLIATGHVNIAWDGDVLPA